MSQCERACSCKDLTKEKRLSQTGSDILTRRFCTFSQVMGALCWTESMSELWPTCPDGHNLPRPRPQAMNAHAHSTVALTKKDCALRVHGPSAPTLLPSPGHRAQLLEEVPEDLVGMLRSFISMQCAKWSELRQIKPLQPFCTGGRATCER